MSKFITEHNLNTEISNIFSDADRKLILISPYIKLHSRFKDILRLKQKNFKLSITIVFGKNENDITKSLTQEDFEFLKQFPNIELRYEPRLHAKYYANDLVSILTSMNLYDFSQNNNIEVGILTENSILGNITSSLDIHKTLDNDQFSYFNDVIENSIIKFKNEPILTGILFKELEKINCVKDDLSQLYTKTINLTEEKLVSVSALSKEHKISSKEILIKFEQLNFIKKINEDWDITTIGKSKGVEFKNGQHGKYIAYPQSIKEFL